MADLRNGYPTDADFKEAVCIDAGRVYDSCCDRDCLEDLRCCFLPEAQALVNNAVSVRLKDAEVLNVFIDVEPVNFKKGFYSCDLTFFFLLKFDIFTAPNTCPQTVCGVAWYNKKVILFGSDGNVKIFTSEIKENEIDEQLNDTFSDERIISTPNSKVKVYIIPTNEEVMIARDVIRLTK